MARDIEQEKRLLDEVIEALESLHEFLGRTTYRYADQERMTLCIRLLLAAGTRHLKAARNDMRDGWAPESVPHIRACWETAVDVGFLLRQSGVKRNELSHQYLSMLYLRVPLISERLGDPDELKKLDGSTRATVAQLQREFAGSPALDLRNHWSGVERGKVRDDAFEHLEEFFGTYANWRIVKRILFDVGSASVHADPGMNLWLPSDAAGNPTLGMSSDRHPFWISGAAAGLLLLAASASRGSEDHRRRPRELFERFHSCVASRVDTTE